LPEVCTLLRENVAILADHSGWDGIVCENRDGDDRPHRHIPQLERASEMEAHHADQHPMVTLKVRSLPWGNEDPVQDLSTELKSYYNVETKRECVRLTIICSDLVRTILLVPTSRTSMADGIDLLRALI
jgi:hypothetical protein